MGMTSEQRRQIGLQKKESYWLASFTAMSSPCEILIRDVDSSEAEELASLAFVEATRIEQKFSRYRKDNIIYAINHSNGVLLEVDEETAQLLQYAGQCHALSGGMFDITSGVLRRAWTFDGREVTPDTGLISSLLELVGWDKVKFEGGAIKLRPGMEIDLGGIGKEYAVDKVAQLLFKAGGRPLMVNFGGDIKAIGPGAGQKPWRVGVESPAEDDSAIGLIELADGAVATSGSSRRHCYVHGRRLGHILDPRTGWPVANPPRSVTVLADHCLEAGLFATLAMLQGENAEAFLAAQQIVHHCIR